MSQATPPPPADALPSRDGRDLRWEGHREQRRADLVDATIRAVRHHGAAVGMDEIAAAAGTSKTVIYRHFGDKAGLYRAVADRIDERVFRHVSAALAQPSGGGTPREGTDATDPSRVVASTVDAYLSLVEADPEVYRFVVSRPLVGRPLPNDPVEATTDRVVELLVQALPTDQAAPDVARTWALALVGAVHAVADDWLLTPDRPPRQALVATLTRLAWHGLAPVLGPSPRQ
jgi:AcrR family transcriptional regulator